MSQDASILRLTKLPRKSLFRVTADVESDGICLSSKILYRLASTMTDLGKTFIVEEVVPERKSPGAYNYRLDAIIRIPRDTAKAIEVYRVR